MKTRYFYGYTIVAAGFVIQALCIGAMFTFGVFFKEFEAEFGWSRAMVSGASSLAFFVMGAAGILAGSLNDRIGPRPILVVSGISLGIGYMLMSQLKAPWQLYLLYGLSVGIGFSTHDVITLSTVARWFDRRRGTMTGIVKVGTGSGQLAGPLIAAVLIAAVGWRSAYVIIGAGALAALVAAALLMRRDPEGLGLRADGVGGDRSSAGGMAASSLSLAEAFRTGRFWILCGVEFAVFFCLFTMVVHIVPFARDQGLPQGVAAGVLSTVGGVSIIGRAVMGAVNDRIGGKRSLIVCFIVLLGGLLWLQLARGTWTLFVFAFLYGLAHGGFFTVISPTVAEFFGTGSHGILFGMVLFSGTVGGSVGPLLTGRIFDVTGSYRMAFMLLSVLVMIGFLLISFLRRPEGAGAAHRYVIARDK